MNEIITRLLDWCYEHDYDVSIDTKLTNKPSSYSYVSVILSRDCYHVRHIFNLSGFSENENKFPSEVWFDRRCDLELLSFLDEAKYQFSIHEAEAKSDGKM